MVVGRRERGLQVDLRSLELDVERAQGLEATGARGLERATRLRPERDARGDLGEVVEQRAEVLRHEPAQGRRVVGRGRLGKPAVARVGEGGQWRIDVQVGCRGVHEAAEAR